MSYVALNYSSVFQLWNCEPVDSLVAVYLTQITVYSPPCILAIVHTNWKFAISVGRSKRAVIIFSRFFLINVRYTIDIAVTHRIIYTCFITNCSSNCSCIYTHMQYIPIRIPGRALRILYYAASTAGEKL